MENNMPTRKSTRLRNYDYSSCGAYFVTICTQDRKRILSEIVRPSFTDVAETVVTDSVGEGLAPPESEIATQNFTGIAKRLDVVAVGEVAQSSCAGGDLLSNKRLAPPEVRLTQIGKIAEEQLLLLENRYQNLTIEDYVIMPDHIHIIMFLRGTGGASPSPTVHDIVCAFKSLTSRLCKQRHGIEKMFQRSCAEHIIRDQKDYETRRKYIYENPIRWYYEKENPR